MIGQKLAVVTGGSSGIGHAVSSRLALEGYNVVNADITPPPSGNPLVRHIQCDVTKRDDIASLSGVIQETGGPDVLVLNAGRGIHERIREGDPEKWAEIININICGTLRVLRALLPFMKKGNIIFISSLSATNPFPYGGIYACSKNALNTIAEFLRTEEQGIRITVISPGVVNTPFFENMAAGGHSVESIGQGSVQPEDIADAVMFILSVKVPAVIGNISVFPMGQIMQISHRI